MFLVESLRTSFGKASPFALHIFLIFGVIFYTIIGALIIKHLESPERVGSSKKSEPIDDRIVINITGMTAADLIKLDPAVNDCVLSSLVDIFSKVGCDDDDALDQTAISTIDDCYRSINVPGVDVKIVDAAQERKRDISTTSTPVEEATEEVIESKWNFENALIFSFTVITTIGYGHIVPETTMGRLFVIIYGIIGVPLTLLTIADLGMFIAKGLHYALFGLSKLSRLILKKVRKSISARRPPSIEERIVNGEVQATTSDQSEETEEEEEEREPRKLDETLTLLLIFGLYLLIGARVLASYEPDMGFFEAFYFNFVTLTTIGLGDFVPKSTEYLFVTLCYIGVGLALTTMCVEIMADGLKKLHYFGRKVKNAGSVFVWFGGEKIRLDRLLKNLGDQLNIPEEELLNFQMETFVEQAIKVEDGEIATLRRPVVMRDRPFSYSTIRKSDDSARLHFVDSTRSSKLAPTDTVGLPPLAYETERSMKLDALNRLRGRRMDSTTTASDTGRRSKVRFSQASFDGSISSNSMDYSAEDLPTLRV